jgi:predicted PurR-regulated permease PerM
MGYQQPGRDATTATDIAATLRLIALAAALVLLLWLLSDITLLIFLAVLLAVMLRGTADWLAQHTGASERLMLTLVALAAATATAAFVVLVGPRLIDESQQLWQQLDQQVHTLRDLYGNTSWGHAIFAHLSPSAAMRQHIASYAGDILTSTIGGFATAFVLLVTALYFAISPRLYLRGFVRLFPSPYRPRAHAVLLHIAYTLRWWSLGQLIDMSVVGVLTGIGLVCLGVPLALALAVLAGLLTFIPYFGAIVAAVPAVLVALTDGWQTALWVLLLFLACHAIEGYVVSPLVQRRTVHLPPALSILSMTILGTLFGTLGVILGTPVVAALLVVVREVYVADVLGDATAIAAERMPQH